MEALRAHIEKIVPVTDAEFEIIRACFKVKKLRKHQFLVQEGDTVHSQYDYFVLKGLLKAYHTDEAGHEHILQFAPEDWWVADYYACLNHSPAIINIDCIENSELLSISYDDREKLCAGMQKMEHFFRKKSNAGYVAQQRRILSLLNNNARERYEQFLTLYPGLTQRVSKTMIASYLGVSRETLSRVSS